MLAFSPTKTNWKRRSFTTIYHLATWVLSKKYFHRIRDVWRFVHFRMWIRKSDYIYYQTNYSRLSTTSDLNLSSRREYGPVYCTHAYNIYRLFVIPAKTQTASVVMMDLLLSTSSRTMSLHPLKWVLVNPNARFQLFGPPAKDFVHCGCGVPSLGSFLLSTKRGSNDEQAPIRNLYIHCEYRISFVHLRCLQRFSLFA